MKNGMTNLVKKCLLNFFIYLCMSFTSAVAGNEWIYDLISKKPQKGKVYSSKEVLHMDSGASVELEITKSDDGLIRFEIEDKGNADGYSCFLYELNLNTKSGYVANIFPSERCQNKFKNVKIGGNSILQVVDELRAHFKKFKFEISSNSLRDESRVHSRYQTVDESSSLTFLHLFHDKKERLSWYGSKGYLPLREDCRDHYLNAVKEITNLNIKEVFDRISETKPAPDIKTQEYTGKKPGVKESVAKRNQEIRDEYRKYIERYMEDRTTCIAMLNQFNAKNEGETLSDFFDYLWYADNGVHSKNYNACFRVVFPNGPEIDYSFYFIGLTNYWQAYPWSHDYQTIKSCSEELTKIYPNEASHESGDKCINGVPPFGVEGPIDQTMSLAKKLRELDSKHSKSSL